MLKTITGPIEKLPNHFYPFFWQHGEDEETLVTYVEKIHQSGMRAVCVESRPHPDFVGDKWWEDLGIIIRECEKRGMEIWVLDDSHFPTGFANGQIRDAFPALRKQYLSMRRYDVAGPMKKARIDASMLKGRPWSKERTDVIETLGVYMAKRTSNYTVEGDPIDPTTLVDITDRYQNDTIQLDLEKGIWSVFVVFSTHSGGEEATKDYLNPLVKEATQVLVEEVYEKHLQQVGDHFGKTITAFFSDEPRFGNQKGMESRIGKLDMVLPWRPGLEKELAFEPILLPLLWTPADGAEKEVRYAYMDKITTLYNENFTKVLADWCEDKGVAYLGHNIEDNGAHARLGYGAGHFFRAQEAQHFSGIDVIGTQVVPGMPFHHDAFQTGGSDGEFYHFALAKLGASAAHLTAHKNGRAMCEAFGAYGWNEGLKTMKWITDHLLVRGINYLVPHAFSPKEFPDWDCPPHFYARGNNPQFRYMTHLTDYANRLMSIFNGGNHRAPVAVAYPAEFEWAGEAMPVERPVRLLTESQIDMDIVSFDHLKDALVIDNKLRILNETFEVLVIPYASYMPKAMMEILERLKQEGLRIILVDNLPENFDAAVKDGYEVSPLQELPKHLDDVRELKLAQPFRELVYYHYEKDGNDYWLFFNESISEVVDTTVSIPSYPGKNGYAFDAYHNQVNELEVSQEGIALKLAPYETLVWVFTEEQMAATAGEPQKESERKPIEAEWEVSFAGALAYPSFESVTTLQNGIQALSDLEGYDRAAGTVAYETQLDVTDTNRIIGLDLGMVYEIAEVFVNGQSIGTKIAPPYVFDAKDSFREGKNTMRIEVTNTLGTSLRDPLSQYLLIEPFGMTEEINLIYGIKA